MMRAPLPKGKPGRPIVYDSEGHRLFALYMDLIQFQRGAVVQHQWQRKSAVGKARWRVLAEYFGRDYEKATK